MENIYKKNTKKNLIIIHPVKDRTRFLQILSKKKLPNYESAECFCHRNTIQNPTHLVFECSEYRADRVEAFEGLDND